jgi:hypothetical protein
MTVQIGSVTFHAWPEEIQALQDMVNGTVAKHQDNVCQDCDRCDCDVCSVNFIGVKGDEEEDALVE